MTSIKDVSQVTFFCVVCKRVFEDNEIFCPNNCHLERIMTPFNVLSNPFPIKSNHKGAKNMIELGKEGRDKITGFKGIIVAKIEFLFGCNQYGIAPRMDEIGKIQDTHYFDEGRIEIIGDGIKPEDVQVEKKGGINRDAPTGSI